MRSILAAALLLISVAAPAWAGPKETVETRTYDVDASTIEDMRAEMTAKGPEGYWAYTTWYVSWSSGCDVEVRIIFTFPNWTAYDDAPANLQERWDSFMEHLEAHEEGHAENGRGAAQEIEDTRCGEDPYAILRNWANEDKNYDSETDHGRTQGAVF